jgi:hypothetical protein
VDPHARQGRLESPAQVARVDLHHLHAPAGQLDPALGHPGVNGVVQQVIASRQPAVVLGQRDQLVPHLLLDEHLLPVLADDPYHLLHETLLDKTLEGGSNALVWFRVASPSIHENPTESRMQITVAITIVIG